MWELIAQLLNSKNQTQPAPVGGSTRGMAGMMSLLGGAPSFGTTGGIPMGMGQIQGIPTFGTVPQGLGTVGVTSPALMQQAQASGLGPQLAAGNQLAEMSGLAGQPTPAPDQAPQGANPLPGIIAQILSAPVQQTGISGGGTRGVLPGFQPQMPTFRFNAQGFLTRGGL